MRRVFLRRTALLSGVWCAAGLVWLAGARAEEPKKAAAAGAAVAGPAGEFVEQVLVDEPDFSFVAKYRKRAAFGSTDLMRIELKNKSDAPISFDRFKCRIEGRSFRLDSKKQTAGNWEYLHGTTDLELFYTNHPKEGRRHPYILPGESRTDAEGFSLRLAAELECPPECGLKIKGKWVVEIKTVDGRIGKQKDEATPIEFELHYPNAAEFAALNETCRRLLTTEIHHHWDQELRRTLLGDDRTSATVEATDIVAGLRLARVPRGYSYDIGEFASKKFVGNQHVIDTYRESLEAGHTSTVHDLFGHPALWDPSYVRPLVGVCAEGGSASETALKLLDRNRIDWQDNWQVSWLFSTDIRSNFRRVLDQPPAKLTDRQIDAWAYAVERLSRTNDLEMIAIMRAGLDDKRRLTLGKTENASSLANTVRPLRVCDAALDGILRLLDGPIEPVYKKLGLKKEYGTTEDYARLQMRFDEARDKMIADLKVRLAARDSAAKADGAAKPDAAAKPEGATPAKPQAKAEDKSPAKSK